MKKLLLAIALFTFAIPTFAWTVKINSEVDGLINITDQTANITLSDGASINVTPYDTEIIVSWANVGSQFTIQLFYFNDDGDEVSGEIFIIDEETLTEEQALEKP